MGAKIIHVNVDFYLARGVAGCMVVIRTSKQGEQDDHHD
jgi:hypothetical protein